MHCDGLLRGILRISSAVFACLCAEWPVPLGQTSPPVKMSPAVVIPLPRHYSNPDKTCIEGFLGCWSCYMEQSSCEHPSTEIHVNLTFICQNSHIINLFCLKFFFVLLRCRKVLTDLTLLPQRLSGFFFRPPALRHSRGLLSYNRGNLLHISWCCQVYLILINIFGVTRNVYWLLLFAAVQQLIG